MSKIAETDHGTAPSDATVAAHPPSLRHRLRALLLSEPFWSWVGPGLVTLFGAFLRFYRLGVPNATDFPVSGGRIFDENYYTCDAHDLLRFGVEHHHTVGTCVLGSGPGYGGHPPLAKWFIAAGEFFVGNNPFGWRFASAVVGSLAILILARTARRLTGSTLLGCFAGLLLALDGLEFVQSRIAMLDIFVMFWVVAAFACLVADRYRREPRDAREAEVKESSHRSRLPGPLRGVRWWRLGAGICLGAAAASKWNGVFYMVAFALLVVGWDALARRASGARDWLRTTIRRDAPGNVVAFGIVPLTVYTLSWLGWFMGNSQISANYPTFHPGEGFLQRVSAVIHGWINYQTGSYQYFGTFTASNPHVLHTGPGAGWWQWLVLYRPVVYYPTPHSFLTNGYAFRCPQSSRGCMKEVLAIGTPAIWWLALPAIAFMLWLWASRRDWRAGAVVIGWAAGILPWIPQDIHHRVLYQYYALPAVPFMVLALTLSAGFILEKSRGSPRGRFLSRAGLGTYTVLVAVNFFYLYPILAAELIPYSSWQARLWFGSWL